MSYRTVLPHTPPNAAAPGLSSASILDLVIFYWLCGLLFFGPLAFGAVEEWAISTLEIGAAVLLLTWAARQIAGGEIRIAWTPVYVPVLLFAAIVTSQLALRTSALPWVTRGQFLQYGEYALLFFIALNCTGGDRRKLLIFALSSFGFAVALFAVLQDAASNHKLYWVRETNNFIAIYGPYVNRSHYAGLMEMLLPFPLVAMLDRRVSGGKRLILGFAAVFMGGSVFLSLSRGGMVSLIAELLFLASALAWTRREKRTALGVGIAVMGILAFVLWYGPGHVLDRISSLNSVDASTSIRATIIKDSIPMVKQRPWTGWGLGTFPDVYPGFRTIYSSKWINAAHNDYAQVLVETGALGFVCVLLFIGLIYAGGLRNLRVHSDRYSSIVVMAALTGFTGLLVHSTVDFNLQVPANATLFYVLGALAAAPLPAVRQRRHIYAQASDLNSAAAPVPVRATVLPQIEN